jgi:hypothetical protein
VYSYIIWNVIKLSIKLKFIKIANLLKNLAITFLLSQYLNFLFKSLAPVIDGLKNLGENDKSVKRGSRVISRIFKIATDLGKNLTGAEIISLPYAILVSVLLSNLFKRLNNVFEDLITLGQNWTKVRMGINAVRAVFIDSTLQKSIIGIFTSFDRDKTGKSLNVVPQLLLTMLVSKQLTFIFRTLRTTIETLSEAGSKYRSIKGGINAIGLIFEGNLFNKSLVRILSGITIEQAVAILRAIPAIIAMSLALSLFTPVINLLILTGKNKRSIKRGIRAFDIILNKMVRMIYRFNARMTTKALVEFTGKSLMLLGGMIPLIVMTTLLGMTAGLAIGAVVAITALFVVVTMTILIINITNRTKNIPEGLFDVAAMIGSLSVAAIAISTISAMVFNFVNILLFVSVFSGLILIMSGLSSLLGKKGLILIKGSALLIVVSSALYVCSLIIEKLSQININIKNIANSILCILGIVGLASLIGLATPLLVLAVVGMISLFVVTSLLILIALELQILSELDTKTFEQAEINIDLIFKSCDKIINSFLNHTVGTPEKDNNSWTAGLLKFVGGPIAQIIEAILAMAYVALIFVAITFIVIIAAELSLLANINIDYDKVSENIDKIFNTSDMIIRKITEKKSDKWQSAHDKLGVFGPLITYVAQPLANILTGIFSVLQIAITFIAVTFILLIAVELSLLQKINLDETKINENVTKVLNTADLVRNLIISQKVKQQKNEERGWLRKALGAIPLVSNMTDLIEGIMNVGNIAMTFLSIGLITLIAKNLKTLSDIDLNRDTIESKVKQVIELSNIVADNVNSSEVKSINEDKIKHFGKYVDDSVKYFEGINKLDVSKVKSLGDMYTKMGQFMEKLQDAPINDIADALVNKISPALSDINNNLNKKSTQATQTAPANSTNNASNIQTTQTTPNNPVASNQPIKQIDYSGMLENIEDLLEQIKKKLNSQPQPAF